MENLDQVRTKLQSKVMQWKPEKARLKEKNKDKPKLLVTENLEKK